MKKYQTRLVDQLESQPSPLTSDKPNIISATSNSQKLKRAPEQTLQGSSKFLKIGRNMKKDQTRLVDQLEFQPSPLTSDKPNIISAVPVGPRFQVEIPEWTGLPTNYEGETLKYLGTELRKRTETPERELELSRDTQKEGSTCLCLSPGSPKCVQFHVEQKRICLQKALGPAFYTTGFDNMGEGVKQSWTKDEQESFNNIMRKTTAQKNKEGFLKQAMEEIPNKSAANIVSYYYNVFIIHRMSKQSRERPFQVDSGDDQQGKSKYLTHS